MDPNENDQPKHGPHGPDCRCGMDGFDRTGNIAVDTMRFTTWAMSVPDVHEALIAMYPGGPGTLNN